MQSDSNPSNYYCFASYKTLGARMSETNLMQGKRLIEELSQREKSLESKHKAELNALKMRQKRELDALKERYKSVTQKPKASKSLH